MLIKIGKIELDDWTTLSYPARYSINYRELTDGCVWLNRVYSSEEIGGPHMWQPYFCHELHFLDRFFSETYGKYIPGTLETAMARADEFLIRMHQLLPFL